MLYGKWKDYPERKQQKRMNKIMNRIGIVCNKSINKQNNRKEHDLSRRLSVSIHAEAWAPLLEEQSSVRAFFYSKIFMPLNYVCSEFFRIDIFQTKSITLNPPYSLKSLNVQNV